MYQRSLGAASLVVAGTNVGQILNLITGLFVGSSYDATHQVILQRAQTVAQDPNLTTVAAQQAWEGLRCWAGDQSVITAADTAFLFGSGSVAQGCGCEVAHGCRTDAQTAVATLKQQFPQLVTGNLSVAPYTNPSTGLPTTPPASGYGPTIGIPIPTSTFLSAQVGGIPVWLIGLGLGALAVSRGRS